MPKICTGKPKISVTTQKNHVTTRTNIAYRIINCSAKPIYLYMGQRHLQNAELRQPNGEWRRYRLGVLPEAPLPPGIIPFDKIAPGESVERTRYIRSIYIPEQNIYQEMPSGVYRFIITVNPQPSHDNEEEIYSNEVYVESVGSQPKR